MTGRIRPPGTVVRAGRRPSSAALVVLVVLAACGAATPVVELRPDQRVHHRRPLPGAYPELEALLPTTYHGDGARRPSTRAGTARRRPSGSLADTGIDEVRFAGGTWALGGTTGLTVAVFEGDGPRRREPRSAFYDDERRHGRGRTDEARGRPTPTVGGHAGTPARHLDGDGTGQTVVVVAGRGSPDSVNVVLADDLGDAKVAEALEAFAAP